MNKLYRSIYDQAQGVWVAVSKSASARGKKSSVGAATRAQSGACRRKARARAVGAAVAVVLCGAICPVAVASYGSSVAGGADSVTGAGAPTGTGFATGAAAPASAVSVCLRFERRPTNLAAGAAVNINVNVNVNVNVNQLKAVTGNLNTVIGQTVFDPMTGQPVAPVFIVQRATCNNPTPSTSTSSTTHRPTTPRS